MKILRATQAGLEENYLLLDDGVSERDDYAVGQGPDTVEDYRW